VASGWWLVAVSPRPPPLATTHYPLPTTHYPLATTMVIPGLEIEERHSKILEQPLAAPRAGIMLH
jgi:hypothetical protein